MEKKYLKRAAEIALKSGCLRGKRGAVIVGNGKIIAEGCNMPFPDNQFCAEHGCLRDKLNLGLGRELEKCRSIHAEANAIAQAGKQGVELEGSTIYITCQPCMNCAKLIIASGIKKVYYLDKYGDQTPLRLLEKMEVKCQRVKLEGDDPSKRLRDPSGQ